jgi:hypothetical protein
MKTWIEYLERITLILVLFQGGVKECDTQKDATSYN